MPDAGGFTFNQDVNRKREERPTASPKETGAKESGFQQESGMGASKDANSDARRLSDEETRLDKTIEDSFPASDPPSGAITRIGW